MTDQVDVFKEADDKPVTQVTEATAPVTIPSDIAKELVGEGKKYATVEAALQSVPHAQNHIARLEQEMKELRDELTKSKSAEQVLAELREEMASTANRTEATTSSEITPQAINELVAKAIDSKAAAAQAEANLQFSNKVMKEKYGEKAQEVFVARAQELGLSINDLKTTASRSPKAFLALMGTEASPQSNTGSLQSTSSSVNTEILAQQNKQADKPSPKVAPGATTKDMVSAWRASKPE